MRNNISSHVMMKNVALQYISEWHRNAMVGRYDESFEEDKLWADA
jgi:hypothetical protein